MNKTVLVVGLLAVLVMAVILFYPNAEDAQEQYNLTEQGYIKVIPNPAEQISFNGTPLIDHTYFNKSLNKCAGSNAGKSIEVYNCEAHDFDMKDIEYYVNISSAQDANLSILAVFEGELLSSSVDALVNESYQYNEEVTANAWVSNYLVDNVLGYSTIGTPDIRCQFGNLNNTQMYLVNRSVNGNFSSSYYCFTNRTVVNSTAFRISGNYDSVSTVQKTGYRNKWVKISDSFTRLGKGLLNDNYTYFKSDERHFDAGKSIMLKVKFTPANASNRLKWHLFLSNADKTLIDNIKTYDYVYFDPWASSNYTYRELYYVNFTHTGTVTNGSYMMRVTYRTGMQVDFKDVILVNDSGYQYADWEYNNVCVNSTYCDYFFNYPPSATSATRTQFYVYWGDASAVRASSIDKTFKLGDDFTTALDTSKWQSANIALYSTSGGELVMNGTTNTGQPLQSIIQFSGGYMTEARAKATTTGFDLYCDYTMTSTGYKGSEISEIKDTSGQTRAWVNGGSNSGGNSVQNVYYRLEGKIVNATYAVTNVSSDARVQNVTKADVPSGDNGKVGFLPYGAGTAYKADWIYVRPYVSTEPIVTASGVVEQLVTTPVITWKAQVPADISSTNVLSQKVNISYTFTFPNSQDDPSTFGLGYKVNSSNGECVSYLNGQQYQCGWTNISSLYNVSTDYYFVIEDNKIYPATYNFEESYMEFATKQNLTLTNTNQAVLVNLLNVSNTTRYGFLEFYAENETSTTNQLTVFYCNNSYSTGDFTTSGNCMQLGTILSTTPYNHTHFQNRSKHYVIPFAVNTTDGKIGTVKVTSNSDFILRGAVGAGQWNVKYITNVSRAGNTRQTSNAGTTFTSVNGTADLHVHQYTGTEALNYYAFGYNLTGSYFNSSVQRDLIDLGGLPPSQVAFLSPINDTYTDTVQINYTSAISPNGYNITNYYLNLTNSDGSFNSTIRDNVMNLTYTYNTSTLQQGYYRIRVTAKDQNNLTTDSHSRMFFIDRTAPTVNATSPLNGTNLTTPIQQFYAFAEDNDRLKNATLYIWNATAMKYNVTGAVTGNSTLINLNASLPDGNYKYFFKVYDYAGNYSYSQNVSFGIDLPPTQGNLTLVVTQYPYVDLNVNYDINVGFIVNGSLYTAEPVIMNITAPSGTITSTTLTPNGLTGFYEATFLFSEKGNYAFTIYELASKITAQPISGTFLVREPFYVTFKGYEDKNTSRYINRYAYITAEAGDPALKTNIGNTFNKYLFPFTRELGDTPAFHAQYDSGEATLKLWDAGDYNIRIIDGQVAFEGVYSVPNIQKSYGVDTFIGTVGLNGTNSTYEFYITDKDLHPYTSLINIVLVILLGLFAVLFFVLLFMFPNQPILPLILCVGGAIILIILRVALWLWWQ